MTVGDIFEAFEHKVIPDPPKGSVLLVKVTSSEGIRHVGELLRRRYPQTAIVFCREGDDMQTLDEKMMKRYGWVRET